MSEFEFKYKLILCGPGAVGKTSLLHRFVNDSFSHKNGDILMSSVRRRLDEWKTKLIQTHDPKSRRMGDGPGGHFAEG